MRWRWSEIVFWLATLLPFVLTPSYLVLASQIAITALFAFRSILSLAFRHRLARPCGLFRRRRLHGGLAVASRVGRAIDRSRSRCGGCRTVRLCHELCRGAVPPSRADHDHARHRLVDAGSANSATGLPAVRRPAGHPHLAAVRKIQIRSLRLHRLRLRARWPVPDFPGGAAADPFAVRPGAPRYPRKQRAHAAIGAPIHAHIRTVYTIAAYRRHRGRPAGADDRDRIAGGRSAFSVRPTFWSC